MGRKFRSASSGDTVVNTIKIQQGGTSVNNTTAARTSFNAANKSTINQPNGVAGLNSLGKVTDIVIDGLLTSINIEGDLLEVPIYGELVFKINNYNAFQSYVVQCTNGTCRRQDNLIYYTANGNIGTGTITINGRKLDIEITETKPNKPRIEYPLNYTQVIETSLNIVTSSYISLNNTPHLSSDWELSIDSNFNNIIQSSYNDVLNLTTWLVSNLDIGNIYYIRVRHRDNEGRLSNWSDIKSIRVIPIPIKYPHLEEQKLLASDGNILDTFGWSVTISEDGNRIVIGSPGDDSNTGAVYVFDKINHVWSQGVKLLSNNPSANTDRFGFSVAISGDGNTIVIGSSTYTEASYVNSGAIYVFYYDNQNTTWTQQAKLVANDINANNELGQSVSINRSGNVIIVGDSFDSVYMFTKSGSTWSQKTKIIPSGSITNTRYGKCVYLTPNGNVLAIGASGDSTLGTLAGAVYLFNYDSDSELWINEQKITAYDGAAYDNFGQSVAISGDGNTLVIGSSGDDSKGSIYIYEKVNTTWVFKQKITETSLATSSLFGFSVSISENGSIIAVGSDKAYNTGAVFIYELQNINWIQRIVLTASDINTNDSFGRSLKLINNGSKIIIGSKGNNNSTGSAYVFI